MAEINNNSNVEKKESLTIQNDSFTLWSLKNWAEISKLYEDVQKDISEKKWKVLFFVGWKKELESWKSAEEVIDNIKNFRALAEKNWIKFVPGTILGFSPTEKNKNNEVKKVNDFIKNNFQYFVDYHDIYSKHWSEAAPVLEQTVNSEKEKKFKEISQSKEAKAEMIAWVNKSELEQTIQNLKNSIDSFKKTKDTVFEWTEMTAEQKERTEKIISEREKIISELESILKELENIKNESEVKNKELNVYDSKNKNGGNLDESLKTRVENLQKRIQELVDRQDTLLKEFRSLSRWVKLNDKLSEKEINEMQEITYEDFLKKPKSERLKFVTVGNISSEDILSWKTKDVEINFSYNEKLNYQLWRDLEAWQILPEEVREVTVDWKVYSRDSRVDWEFFDKDWKMLNIKDGTKISITKVISKEDLEKNYTSKLSKDTSKYEKKSDKEIALEAEKRWVPKEVAVKMYSKWQSEIKDDSTRTAALEESFTDLDRKKGEYAEDTNKKAVDSDGKFSLDFLAYLFGWNFNLFEFIAKLFGFKGSEIKKSEKLVESYDHHWDLDLSKYIDSNITKEDVERIRQTKRFQPNSEDTVKLFQISAKVAWFPESWASNSNLHYILWRESGWKVWILNYTLKWVSTDRFRKLAMSSSAKNPVWAKSTASGLWQLLLSNVDKYYPSWRKWIWDPVEEAVWFMKYIADRYGNPDVARSVYWKTWSYVHPKKWKQYKWFKEWY